MTGAAAVDSLIRVPSVCWTADARPVPAPDAAAPEVPGGLRGRFAFAAAGPGGAVTLVRDPLGLNKLFVAFHESGRVLAASYLVDLVRRGVPLEAIASVPAGHAVALHPAERRLTLRRYADPVAPASPARPPERVARAIRDGLERWFAALAARYGARPVAVCLSGGLDSGIVAALARRHFPALTAYTYGFEAPGQGPSEDVSYARRLAEALDLPLRLVPASAADLLDALEDALCYGQDWRDFNVHCAIVNDLLARAIQGDAARRGPGPAPLVLTGDLANELLADYTPVRYAGRDYYTLPRLAPAELRLALVRGLDVGDREVGVFHHRGVEVVQPYALLVEEYLSLPGAFIGQAGAKQRLARDVAGDLLPAFVLDRPKVRAQIGNSSEPTGILPVLLDAGRDAGALRKAFCRLFSTDEAGLGRFVRGGRYRALAAWPGGAILENGYVAH